MIRVDHSAGERAILASMFPAWLPLSCLLYAGFGSPQNAPLAHWELSSEHYRAGRFVPLSGPWPAIVSEPSWLGDPNVKDSRTALLFDADADSIVLDPAVARDDLPIKRLSVTAWVAPDRAPDWGGYLSCIQDNGAHERGWVLGSRGRKFCFGLARADTERLNYLTAEENFTLGQWAHLAGVYDGRNHRLYVNGELVAEAKDKPAPVLYDPQHALVLGAYQDDNERYPMLGAFWEARLYEQALSSRQVARLYRDGLKRLPPIEGNSATKRNPPPDLGELRPQVNHAIDRGVAWLLQQQNRDGSWNERTAQYRNGITSLSALALLESGVPRDHPAIENAKRFVLEAPPQYTYSAALQLMFYAELEDGRLQTPARELVRQLLAWEKSSPRGAWGYPSGPADLSNTQFAALGLWAAHRMGIESSNKLWVRMVETTIGKYMKGEETVLLPNADGHPVKQKIEGFAYFANDTQYPAYGGMVVAGLGVIGLAENLGVRYSPATKRAVEQAKQRALGWLVHYFRVDAVPGYAERLQYYLYGLERVGSLFEWNRFGPHEWYREGAAQLIATQDEDGGWHHTEYGLHHECATGFALLFLNRATAAVTEHDAPREREHGLRQWNEGPVHLRATGSQPLTVWLAAVERPDGKAVDDERHPERRISQVQYFLDGEVLTRLDSSEAGDGRFATQLPIPTPGRYELSAIVSCEDGVLLRSGRMTVEIARTPEAFQRQALAYRGVNLLAKAAASITASSSHGENWLAAQAADGFQHRGWLHAKDDATPWIEFVCERAVIADRLLLSPIDAKLIDEGRSATAETLRVILNGKTDRAQRVTWPEDPMQALELRFAEQESIRSLRIEIESLGQAGKRWAKQTGFAEVSLLRDDD